jgi:hypothetical protein
MSPVVALNRRAIRADECPQFGVERTVGCCVLAPQAATTQPGCRQRDEFAVLHVERLGRLPSRTRPAAIMIPTGWAGSAAQPVCLEKFCHPLRFLLGREPALTSNPTACAPQPVEDCEVRKVFWMPLNTAFLLRSSHWLGWPKDFSLMKTQLCATRAKMPVFLLDEFVLPSKILPPNRERKKLWRSGA